MYKQYSWSDPTGQCEDMRRLSVVGGNALLDPSFENTPRLRHGTAGLNHYGQKNGHGLSGRAFARAGAVKGPIKIGD
jgi:hypothetical protein